jgi:hypothetical protein
VRVFHSPAEALRDFAFGERPLPFPVLADPRRAVYRRFGVSGSLLVLVSLLSRTTRARVQAARGSGLRPRWRDVFRDGIGGYPADFLIDPEGRVARVRYGRHLADSIPVAGALAWIDELRGAATPAPPA